MNRREVLASLGALTLSAFAPRERNKPPTVLIVNGWQAVNIGDIAHVPGLLSFFKAYLPHARLLLWPKNLKGYGVETMLLQNFPSLTILEEGYTSDVFERNLPAIKAASLLIHGSGSGIVAPDPIKWWMQTVNRPYGFFGITLPSFYAEAEPLLRQASFVFTREQLSRKLITDHGISSHVTFVPDSTFNIKLSSDQKVKQYVGDHMLREKKFICVVPRLRYTPYHKFAQVSWPEERIAEVEQVNEKYKHVDHDKLCRVITRWVQATGNAVVVCPEMEYQVDLMKDLILDRLPADVQRRVSMHPYWLTDEAASLYKKAFAVVSLECHSPIIALANGTFGMYLRQKEDTHKGEMYNDLQLGDWMFNLDDADGDEVSNTLLQLYDHPETGYQKIKNAFSIVDKQNTIAAQIIRRYL